MSDAPPRFKERSDWSVEEILVHQRTGKKPESDEYRQAKRDALKAAGLEPDNDSAETPPEEATVEQTLEAIRRHNR